MILKNLQNKRNMPHRENTAVIAIMMLFQMSVPIKKTAVRFTGLPRVSTYCTVGSTFCSVTESNIHMKSYKIYVKF